MSSRSLDDLVPELKEKAEQLVANCKKLHVDILIYCTLRDLEDQARLYRQSRSSQDIRNKVDQLKREGFGFLGDVITKVGPQFGKLGQHVTNAVPGQSWHNLKEAFDAVPIINGKAEWKTSHPHWKIYGQEVMKLGLDWGGSWKSFKDYPHCQLRKGTLNPMRVYTSGDLEKRLKEIGLIR
jgi:peptidoglycan LD-endopeptidase CwlK